MLVVMMVMVAVIVVMLTVMAVKLVMVIMVVVVESLSHAQLCDPMNCSTPLRGRDWVNPLWLSEVTPLTPSR